MPIAFNPADPAQSELIADFGYTLEDFKHDCCAKCDCCEGVYFIGHGGELAHRSFAFHGPHSDWLCVECENEGHSVPSGQSAGDMRAEYGTLFAINGGA